MKVSCIFFVLFISKSIAWNLDPISIPKSSKIERQNLESFEFTIDEELHTINMFDVRSDLNSQMNEFKSSRQKFDAFDLVENLNVLEKFQVFYLLEKTLSSFLKLEDDAAKISNTRKKKIESKNSKAPILRPSTKKLSELLPTLDLLDDQMILDNYLNEGESTEEIIVPKKVEERITRKLKKKKNGFKSKSHE